MFLALERVLLIKSCNEVTTKRVLVFDPGGVLASVCGGGVQFLSIYYYTTCCYCQNKLQWDPRREVLALLVVGKWLS